MKHSRRWIIIRVSGKLLTYFLLFIVIESLALYALYFTYTISRNDVKIRVEKIPYNYEPKVEFLGETETFKELLLVNESYDQWFNGTSEYKFSYPLNLPLNFQGNITILLNFSFLNSPDIIRIRMIGENFNFRDIIFYIFDYNISANASSAVINIVIDFEKILRNTVNVAKFSKIQIIVYKPEKPVTFKLNKVEIIAISKEEIIYLTPILADAYGEILEPAYNQTSPPFPMDVMLKHYILITVISHIQMTFQTSIGELDRFTELYHWYGSHTNITGEPLLICLAENFTFNVSFKVANYSVTYTFTSSDMYGLKPKYVKFFLPIFYMYIKANVGELDPIYVEFYREIYEYYDTSLNYLGYLAKLSSKGEGVPIVPGDCTVELHIGTWDWMVKLRRVHFILYYSLSFEEYGDYILTFEVNLNSVFGVPLPLYLVMFTVTYIIQLIILLILGLYYMIYH